VSSPSPTHACERQVDCAAYVLGALTEQELEAHTAHLAECSICQAEVAQLQPVADLLAVGAPSVRAGRGLRARVLGAARAEAELRDAVVPAAVALTADARTSDALTADAGTLDALTADAPMLDALTADASTSNAPTAARTDARPAQTGAHAPARGWARTRSSTGERSTLRRLFPGRLRPGLAGVLTLGAGVAIGALAFSSSSSVRTEVIHAVVVAPGHHATAELRKVGSRLELVVVGMPAPPPGRIYEVWLEHGAAAPLPTDALFSVTKAGSGSVSVPGDLQGVSKVLVTDEPLGGSLKPTRTPVIVGSV
jgi:hypothetical protein